MFSHPSLSPATLAPTTQTSPDAAEDKPSARAFLQSTTAALGKLFDYTTTKAAELAALTPLPACITGHIDDAPRLLGNTFIGVGNRYHSPLWLQEVVTDCEQKIQADDQHRGLCRFYIFGAPAVYINDINHIKKIYNNPPANATAGIVPKNGETVGIYEFLFGESILTFSHTDPRWSKERSFLVNGMMNPTRLRTQEILLRRLAQTHLDNIVVNNVEELRTFGNRVILDMITQTQLHFFDITPEEKTQLMATVSAALPEMNYLKTAVNLKLEKILGKRFHMPLDDIRSKGETLICRLLERNKSHILRLHDEPQHNSLLMLRIVDIELTKAAEALEQRARANQLTAADQITQTRLTAAEEKHANKQMTDYEFLREKLAIHGINPETISLNTDAIRKFTALVLFSGYETTSTLMFFTLLVLADPQHRHIVEQVRNTTNPEERTRLLEEIIREVGRLYPSFPIFKDLLTQDIQLNAHTTVHKDTMLFYSPYILHRLKGGVSEPQPDKLLLGRKLDEMNDSFNLTIFGPKPRTCPGRKTAMLEIVTLLSELLPRFDMRLDREFDKLPVEACFGLRLAQSLDQRALKISVTPVESIEHKISLGS
jgi:cytochrome P450